MMARRSEGALDQIVWDIAVDMVTAVYDLNLVEYHAAIERMRQYMEPRDFIFGRVFHYLLWRLMSGILQKAPDVADVPAMTDLAWPKFSLMMKADRATVANLIEDVISNRTEESKGPQGEGFIVVSPAVIGALLENPRRQLPLLRALLNDWYGKNYA